MSGQNQDRAQQQRPGQQQRYQYYAGAQQSQPSTPSYQGRPPFQPVPSFPNSRPPFQPGAAPGAPPQYQGAAHPGSQHGATQPAYNQPQAYGQPSYQPGYPQQPGYQQQQPGYQQQPGFHQQQQDGLQQGGPGLQQGFLDGQNALMANLAGNMLQQQGASYIQKGQAFMQSKMGFLSSSLLQYLFNVGSSYVPTKLLMLLTPYLKRWSYIRELEQISGGNKYLPPRQDVNAPDLYIPLCAVATYVLMAATVAVGHKRFSPATMYSLASHAGGAWLLHTVLLKALLYLLGLAAAVPFLELACYAGYPFVAVCLAMAAAALPVSLGPWVYRAAWSYLSLCMAVFMVRTIKRVIFYESRQYSMDGKSHNYILLGLGAFQFVFTWWLAVIK